MFRYFTFFLLCGYLVDANKNVQVGNNHLNGDQNVGGIHFFEFHAPHGGMGLGLKIVLFGGIAILVTYWCIKRQTQQALSQLMIPNPYKDPLALQRQMQMWTFNDIVPVHTPQRRGYDRPRVGPIEDEEA